MSTEDVNILKDFQAESKNLIEELIEILDQCEGDFGRVETLEKYGQTVDRIMGGAQSLVMALSQPSTQVQMIGDYAGLCKAVGYKASQIRDNESFYDICVALLQDATEVLHELVVNLSSEHANIKSYLNQAFLDRLKWVSDKFGAEYRASVKINTGTPVQLAQDEIDQLLKKLGLD